jgi:polyisoprenoid-binding protein YceI
MRRFGSYIELIAITGLIGLLAGILPAGALFAQSPVLRPAAANEVVYQPEPESIIWIEGSSNVNQFTCKSGNIRGFARVTTNGDGTEETSVEVAVPVEALDCGQRQMNRDMYRTLRAGDHPDIRFELVQASVVGTSPDQANTFLIRIEGDLTVAGESRRIVFEAKGSQKDGSRYFVTGSKDILMTDFGLTPPTALLGLVKAHDELVVHFELLAGI